MPIARARSVFVILDIILNIMLSFQSGFHCDQNIDFFHTANISRAKYENRAYPACPFLKVFLTIELFHYFCIDNRGKLYVL